MKKEIKSEYQPSKVNLDIEKLNTVLEVVPDRPYPKLKIILSYILLGGMLGGLLLWIGLGISEKSIIKEVELFGLAVVGGGVIGLLPALLTALVIIKLRVHLQERFDYLKIFAIGGFVSACLTLMIILILNDFKFDEDLLTFGSLFGLAIGAVGGFSSLIIGWFVLPKVERY